MASLTMMGFGRCTKFATELGYSHPTLHPRDIDIMERKELLRYIRHLGFKRTYRRQEWSSIKQRAVDVMVSYEFKPPHGETNFIIQIWHDGKHRVSNEVKGHSIDHPTSFTDTHSLSKAVFEQRQLANTHYDRCRSLAPTHKPNYALSAKHE